MFKNKIGFLPLAVGFAFSLLFLIVEFGFAYRMVPMNLEEMAAKADRIFVAQCLTRSEGEMIVEQGKRPLRFTEYTFQISDTIKGNVGQTLTIRQVRLGGSPGALSTNKEGGGGVQPLDVNPIPLPEYEPGKEVLLFMGEDSILGLTSPISMDQAVFDVNTINGNKYFSNRLGNRLLFRGISIEQLSASKNLSETEMAILQEAGQGPLLGEQEGYGPFPYETFVSLVRKLANGN